MWGQNIKGDMPWEDGMLHKLVATALVLVLAVPALALAGGPELGDKAKPFPGGDETARSYYLLNVTGLHHSEFNFETEVSVVDGFWSVMQCGDTKEIVSYVAMKFGSSDSEFDYHDTPAEIIPLLRHVRSGDFEAWYYVPRCDQLEIKWSRTDLDGVVLGGEDVSFTNRAANIQPREPEFVPQGSISLSL